MANVAYSSQKVQNIQFPKVFCITKAEYVDRGISIDPDFKKVSKKTIDLCFFEGFFPEP